MKSFVISITFFMLGIFSCICYHLLTFSLIFCFLKNSFKNNIRVSNCLDPDQDGHSFSPDLSPNCLHRLSADDKSCC